MIIVDNEKCAGCGLCSRICHENCITIHAGSKAKTIQINLELCSTCTQCIAICPKQALSWDGVQSISFDQNKLPTAIQLEELFKQRRTVRVFKKNRIERALLKEIVAFGIYAPTNNYDLRAILIDDPIIIDSLDEIILNQVTFLYNLFFKSIGVFKVLKTITPLVNPKQKVKLERSVDRGRVFETRPAAMVFVVGDHRIIQSEASAQYALYNMILYAQTKKIGSRIQAAGPMTLDRNSRARMKLGLRKYEHILGTIDLGYPAIKFKNKVEGKSMNIQWNDRRLND